MNRIIEKWVALYQSDLLTAKEFADSWLYDIVNVPEIDPAMVAVFHSLPDEVKLELLRLLQSIKEDGYRWIPFLIGVHIAPRDPYKYSVNLRKLHSLLE